MHAHPDSVYANSLKSSAAWSWVLMFLPLLGRVLGRKGLALLSDAAFWVDVIADARLKWLGANALTEVPTRRDANRTFLYR